MAIRIGNLFSAAARQVSIVELYGQSNSIEFCGRFLLRVKWPRKTQWEFIDFCCLFNVQVAGSFCPFKSK